MSYMMKKLYKQDTLGKIREWRIEIDDNAYRTLAGVLDGKIVVSGWQYAEAKNEGKVNATTPAEQAQSEVASKYLDQVTTGGYYDTIELAKEGIPVFTQPMLAQKYDQKKIKFPVISQPKFDGVRCIATKDGLFSRKGKPLVSVPHIHEALKSYFESFPNHKLDGELYNHELRDDFDKIISLVRKSKPTDEDIAESAKKVNYCVYDVIEPKDRKFTDRFFDVVTEIHGLADSIQPTQSKRVYNQADLDKIYGEYLEDGYEGQMVRYDEKYEAKRSKFLLKRKEFLDEEFEIISVDEGLGNWAGYAKFISIKLGDGSTQKSGLRGDFETNSKRLAEASEYVGGQATVRFQNRTPDGKLRFPVAVALYKGKRDL